MRSIFRTIFLFSLGMLVAAFIGTLVTRTLMLRTQSAASMSQKTLQTQLERARAVFETEGTPPLAAYLKSLGVESADFFLVDESGKDVVNGTDRSALLKQGSFPILIPYLGRTSATRSLFAGDRKYALIVTSRTRLNYYEFFSYYACTFLSILLLSWWLAIHLGRPMHNLRLSLEKFGRGDLAVRVASKRKDEVGELSRSFDHMADRIQGLLAAERRLLQDISHELRSPLARLSCAIELARTADSREEALDRIHKESRRLNALVNQLLEVTTAEGDPSAARIQRVALHELVASVIDDCRIEGEAKQCRLQFAGSAAVEVNGDPELLRRAVENVLRNAIRYAPPESAIEVHLEVSNGLACLRIRDYGKGVPQEHLSDIFKPFFRVESHRGIEGAGLGLALAQRAVGVHHGTMVAENSSPGLRIRIELPVASK